MTWRPMVTEGARRGRICRVIAEIVGALPAHPARERDERADRALLRAYLAADGTVPDPEGDGSRALADAVTHVHTGRIGLFGGLARLGWTIAHLVGGDDADLGCVGIDAEITARLDTAGDYDLISGLVGFGVYALERGEAGRGLASRVLDQLERRARPRLGGLAWHTGPELLVAWQRERAPNGYWNYGLAHGMPGVIALLARMVAAGIEPARSRALLDGAVAHLLAAEPPSDRGRYPSWQPRDVPASPRLAWCYGDLGVSAALFGAALHVGEPRWRAEGLELARACARRSVEDAAIADTGLCHGAMGIAHLLNRMAQAAGDEELAEAARAWFDRALAMRRAEPIAGFPAATPGGERGVVTFTADSTLLTGAAGVALALHAAISEVEPYWDRLLLVDLPLP